MASTLVTSGTSLIETADTSLWLGNAGATPTSISGSASYSATDYELLVTAAATTYALPAATATPIVLRFVCASGADVTVNRDGTDTLPFAETSWQLFEFQTLEFRSRSGLWDLRG